MSWVSGVCPFPLHTEIRLWVRQHGKRGCSREGRRPWALALSQRKCLRSIVPSKVLNHGRKVSEHNGSISLRNQNLGGSQSRDVRGQCHQQALGHRAVCVTHASGRAAEAGKVPAAARHLSHLLKEAI